MLSFSVENGADTVLRFRSDAGQCRFRLFDNGKAPPVLLDKSPDDNGDWSHTVVAGDVPKLGLSLMLEATAATGDGSDLPIWVRVSNDGDADVEPDDSGGVQHDANMGWLLGKASSGVADDFFLALLRK